MKRNTRKEKKKTNKGFPYKKTRKPKKPVVYIFFTILVIFAYLGTTLTGSILHEIVHRHDYRHIDKLSEEICYLDSNIEGYYKFIPETSQDEEIDEITRYTEFKAYGVSIIVGLLFLVSLGVTIKYILGID